MLTPVEVYKNNFATWKQFCPYGIWTCAKKRQVLFNRDYAPILDRHDDGPAAAIYPEWVEYQKSEMLFSDWDAPWRTNEAQTGPSQGAIETLERINNLLQSWDLPTLGKPPKRKTIPWGSKNILVDPFKGRLPPPRRENPWLIILPIVEKVVTKKKHSVLD